VTCKQGLHHLCVDLCVRSFYWVCLSQTPSQQHVCMISSQRYYYITRKVCCEVEWLPPHYAACMRHACMHIRRGARLQRLLRCGSAASCMCVLLCVCLAPVSSRIEQCLLASQHWCTFTFVGESVLRGWGSPVSVLSGRAQFGQSNSQSYLHYAAQASCSVLLRCAVVYRVISGTQWQLSTYAQLCGCMAAAQGASLHAQQCCSSSRRLLD
jgi:hypothetical protein